MNNLTLFDVFLFGACVFFIGFLMSFAVMANSYDAAQARMDQEIRLKAKQAIRIIEEIK